MSDTLKDRTAREKAQKTDWDYATKPTRWTLFTRTFLPWQAWRFVWINLKMIRIMGRGHGGHEK